MFKIVILCVKTTTLYMYHHYKNYSIPYFMYANNLQKCWENMNGATKKYTDKSSNASIYEVIK